MSQSDENCPQNTGSPSEENEPITAKIGSLNDPFEYAPQKPDGNHWEILLKPLLDGDKAQCDAWKDEVSNLLIFAGLFSAVVTAFIIESYKGLQRDPNDDMIFLLSQIVDQLGSTANSTSTSSFQSSGLLPAFSPTRSSIRINIFWFISLVLSLTTVLVGIISLQWLREHQNYVNLTPMQQYAIFHMRREGLEKWHVGKVFSAMPLLLQSALVLFFTGIIDFLLVFGDIAVVIPVAVVIGLSLLFLVATTLFPTLQGFHLFFKGLSSGGRKDTPVQCPYKSPQSDDVRAISFPIFTVLQLVYDIIGTARLEILLWFNFVDWLSLYKLWEGNRTFIRNIHYSDRTWLAFDLEWLAIRDGFMRRAFKRPLQEFRHDSERPGYDPIWDILQGLISQTPPNISLAYYAFMEVSNITLSRSDTPNAYLYDAVAYGSQSSENDVCFDDFYADTISGYVNSRPMAKYQALYKFLHRISYWDDQSDTALHMAEIYFRLMQYLFTHNIPVRPQNGQDFWPDCLVAEYRFFDRPDLQYTIKIMMQELSTTLFKEMSEECPPNALVNVPCARQKGIASFIRCWNRVSFYSRTTDHRVQRAIASLFDVINESLVQELRTVIAPGSENATATLLFYAAALFAWQFIYHEGFGYVWRPSFKTLLSTIRQYKDVTIDKGMSDSKIERSLHERDEYSSTFSDGWWSDLLKDVPPSNSSIIDISYDNGAQSLPSDSSSGELNAN